MSKNVIEMAPKETWSTLTVDQMYELKSQLLNRYYDLRNISESIAKQFFAFSNEVDALIKSTEMAQESEKLKHNQ